MQRRHLDRLAYFGEEVATSQAFYLPYVRSFVGSLESLDIIEIGCGEGGNLLPFFRSGARVTGVDLSEKKIALAKRYFRLNKAQGVFLTDDFLNCPLDCGGFDVVICHDVIEHISPSNKLPFMQRLGALLKERSGVAFIGFPAWQMPFGGHQQMCDHPIISHLPWIHLLPKQVYRGLLSLAGEREGTIRELLEIKESGVSVESFLRLCEESKLEILDSRLWFINPHYQVKFGLVPIELCSFVSGMPYVRNFLSTSCFFVLTD